MKPLIIDLLSRDISRVLDTLRWGSSPEGVLREAYSDCEKIMTFYKDDIESWEISIDNPLPMWPIYCEFTVLFKGHPFCFIKQINVDDVRTFWNERSTQIISPNIVNPDDAWDRAMNGV